MGQRRRLQPRRAITQLTDRLTYENGVAVIFAASNSGGSGAECSGDLRTNVYANTPSAISAGRPHARRHGCDVVFVPRLHEPAAHLAGRWGPQAGTFGPQHHGTAIDASTRTQGDLYYMAISGTSMATPHVGGMAGIPIDVAPSLGAADYHRDDHDFGDSLVGGEGTAAYQQFEDWDERNNSRVHEVELILELTARYEGMENSCEDGNSDDSCNDIPEECLPKLHGSVPRLARRSRTDRRRCGRSPRTHLAADARPGRRRHRGPPRIHRV